MNEQGRASHDPQAQAQTQTQTRAPAARAPRRAAPGAGGTHAKPAPPLPLLQAALSRWENEGGAIAAPQPVADPAAQLAPAQAISTELEQLHIRMIALENLLIALLAQDPDRTGRLARAMATFISPRPGYTRHPRTLGAAAQMVHVVERAHHFQGWHEDEALS